MTKLRRNRVVDPELLDLRSADGTPISAYAWSHPGDDGAVAVVVHGFGDHGRALPYRLLATFLSARGFGVVSYDQRGHGAVAASDRGAATWPALVADLDAVVAALRGRHPTCTLVVVGLSMGAVVALDAALSPDGAIDGVIAVAAPLGAVRASWFALSAAGLLGRWLPRLPLAPKLDLTSIAADGPAVAAYVGDPLFHQVMRAGLAAQLLDTIARLRRDSGLVRCATLFLHGTADRIAPWDASFANGIRADLREVTLFPGLLHNLFLETDREAVFRRIAAWAERRCTSDALGHR